MDFRLDAVLSDVDVAARLVLVLVFAAAVVGKLRDRRGLTDFLAELGVSRSLTTSAAWVVIGMECLAIGLLLVSPAELAGGFVSGLFVVFLVATLLSRRRGSTAPCACFGKRAAPPAKFEHMIVSRAAGAAAGVLVALGGSGPEWPALQGALLASGVIGAYVWIRQARLRGLVDSKMGSSGLAAGLNLPLSRRTVLRRLTLLGAGLGLFPLARAFACTAIPSDPPDPGGGCLTSAAASSTALEGGDRTLCLRACSEQRVTCDAVATDVFDDCALAASTDDDRLLACADAFRRQLISCNTDYQLCAPRC